MGAKCCRCFKETAESVHGSVVKLVDFVNEPTDLKERTMEETRDDAGPSEPEPPSPTEMPEDLEEMFDCVYLGTVEETSNTKQSPEILGQDAVSSCYRASNILWSTGSFSDVIPNGFYSVIPDDRLKLFESIPTLDEINALGDERLKADVILIDFEKDQKICMLKELIKRLVMGLNSKPVTVIKKIAGLVADVYYKRRPLRSRTKTTQSSESRGFPLLGHIKHGSCRARAIFFKVLADSVGFESKLVMGFPSDLRSSASIDSYNHMSVVVVLNTVEMLVDLTRCPGQLIPFSSRAIYMAHISLAAATDSALNDSCDTPLELNSPMHGYMDRINHASFLSLSRSESSIAEFWRRRVSTEQCTAHFSCNSDEAAKPETKRRRRNRMKTSEISDDIARVMRVMKESRFLKKRGDDDLSPHSPDDENVSGFHLDSHEQVSGGRSTLNLQKAISLPSSPMTKVFDFHHDSHDQVSGGRSTLDPQKAIISSPSSPQNYQPQSSKKSGPSHQKISHLWNEVLESPMFQNKPLLPYEEWNIGFSELTVGAPVGSGSFGVVFHGIWNGTDVAIKRLLEKQLTAENMEDFCNEISILSRLRHPNVILFLGACTKPPQLSVVTEFMERGSLYDVLRTRQKKLSWKRKLKMLRDICRGVMCIHRMGIVHRDLKSANCLISNKGIVKICDFGLSRMMKGTTVKDGEAAGTPEWMAPELIRNEPFSEKCDIFSFGVIMWELCTLSKPWEGVPKERVIHIVANEGARLTIPEGPLSELIADCWSEPAKAEL